MLKRLSKIMLVVMIASSLLACGNTEKKVIEFDKLVNNKDYEFAYDLYKENSKDKKFINEVKEIISKKLVEYEESIKDENTVEVKIFIDFADKIIDSDKISSINDKLSNLNNDKEVFESAKKHINEESYYLGVLKLKDIKDESEYHTRAVELINENLAKARAEKLDSARRLLEGKSYDSAILALEDINKLVGEEDIEVNKLISEYKVAKESHNNGNNVVSENTNTSNDNEYFNINYKNYYNTRFGYSIDYPDFLIEQPAPTNNDGRNFKSEDGEVSLLLYGNYNPLFETAEDVFNRRVSEKINISYKNLLGRSYVISWSEGSYVYYTCGIVDENLACEFTLKYPSKDEKAFDSIVQRCYDSFTTGNLY